MQMTCPKCHGEMRVYERSGVTVDQCTECRGIFLDRGELEKLFDAEANWNSQHAGGGAARPPQLAITDAVGPRNQRVRRGLGHGRERGRLQCLG